MDFSNSVIIINKPCGQTSHEITVFVKKILGAERTGHAGTLDPDVSGVLPVAVGKATKLLQYIAGKDKTYVGIVKFRNPIAESELKILFDSFVGEITQTPPKISAVRKIPRKRKIHYLKILETNGRLALFEVKVDAGTYIRTLCEDMGKKTGGARMVELRRIAVGRITEKEAFTMQDLIDAVWLRTNKNDDLLLRKMLKRPEEFIDFPKVFVKENAVRELKNGAQLAVPGILRFESGIKKGERVAIYSEKNEFVGVGSAKMDGTEISKNKKGITVKSERIHI